MLEIAVILVLWRKMREMMQRRGYEKTVWFQIFVPLSWIVGEVGSAVVYYVVLKFSGMPKPLGIDPTLYLIAFAGAGVATGLTFLISSGFRRAVPPPLPFGNAQMPDAGKQLPLRRRRAARAARRGWLG